MGDVVANDVFRSLHLTQGLRKGYGISPNNAGLVHEGDEVERSLRCDLVVEELRVNRSTSGSDAMVGARQRDGCHSRHPEGMNMIGRLRAAWPLALSGLSPNLPFDGHPQLCSNRVCFVTAFHRHPPVGNVLCAEFDKQVRWFHLGNQAARYVTKYPERLFKAGVSQDASILREVFHLANDAVTPRMASRRCGCSWRSPDNNDLMCAPRSGH